MNDEHVVFSASTFMDELLGVDETCVSLPHVLSAQGASQPFLPPLDLVEEAALLHSAGVLRAAIRAALKYG